MLTKVANKTTEARLIRTSTSAISRRWLPHHTTSRARARDDVADGRDDEIGRVELDPVRAADGDDLASVRRQPGERAMSRDRGVWLIAGRDNHEGDRRN